MRSIIGKAGLFLHIAYLWLVDPQVTPRRTKVLGIIATVIFVAVPEWLPYLVAPVLLVFLLLVFLRILENREYRKRSIKPRTTPNEPIRFTTQVIDTRVEKLLGK